MQIDTRTCSLQKNDSQPPSCYCVSDTVRRTPKRRVCCQLRIIEGTDKGNERLVAAAKKGAWARGLHLVFPAWHFFHHSAVEHSRFRKRFQFLSQLVQADKTVHVCQGFWYGDKRARVYQCVNITRGGIKRVRTSGSPVMAGLCAAQHLYARRAGRSGQAGQHYHCIECTCRRLFSGCTSACSGLRRTNQQPI